MILRVNDERDRTIVRISLARRLLVADNYDAATAAYRVGYDDPSHFNREYKRLFGALPMRDDRDQNHHAKPGDRPRAVAASRWLPGGSALASSIHRLDNGDAAGWSGRGRVSAARAGRPRGRRCRGVCRARPVVQNPGPPDSVKGV